MINRVMTTDNIGLAVVLQSKESTKSLLVCNSHLHWNPQHADVKLVQMLMLVNEISRIRDQSISHGSNIELVLCGDFNSLPSSAVIRFLVLGRVSMNHREFQGFDYKSSLEKLLGGETKENYSHSLQLASADNGVMQNTNYTFNNKAVVDYVFHSRSGLVATHILGDVDRNWLQRNHIHGCPHHHIPSDHFPLLVEFALL